MLQPGRKYSSQSGYRYGFNGKENDKDAKGDGNSLDFGARILDPRIGRWLSKDPLQEKYPNLSVYQFCANAPINAKDPDGKVIIFINGMWGSTFGISQPLEPYWNALNKNWVKDVQNQIEGPNSREPLFFDGSLGGEDAIKNKGLLAGPLVAANRILAGERAGYANAAAILGKLDKGETITLVTNSMGAAFERGFTKGLLKYQAQVNESRTTFNNDIDTKILMLNFEKYSVTHSPTYSPNTPLSKEDVTKIVNDINKKIGALNASKKKLLNIRIEMNIDLSSHQIDYADPNAEKNFYMIATHITKMEHFGGFGVNERKIGAPAVQIGVNPDGTSQMTGHFGPNAPPAAMPPSDTKPTHTP